MRAERMRGLMLGLMVGDALGLPAEGLSPRRRARLFPGPLRHRFFFGRGMVSDDTEHAVFVAGALLASPDDPAAFQRRLARDLKVWLLMLPAGVGLATLRACCKLLVGFPPDRSGVWSAGNGPAMRSAPIGGFFAEDPARRAAFVAASSRLTHTDPKATIAAQAVADAAAFAVRHGRAPRGDEVAGCLAPGRDADWDGRMAGLVEALDAGREVGAYAAGLGLGRGVTGYAYHTVPVALFAWLRHAGDFRATLEAAIGAGGDADTVGAIAGALAGATVGEGGLPAAWVAGVRDVPRGPALVRALADRLAEGGAPVPYGWAPVPARNLAFLAIVLAHAGRRALPPW